MPIYKAEGKRDGLQKYLVRINYRDPFGKPRQLTRVCYGRAEAQELERKLTSGGQEAAPIKTFAELQSAYLENLKISIKQASFRTFEKCIRLYIAPYYEKSKLSNLTAASLLKWKSGLAEKGLSVHYLQNIYTVFSAMLNFGVRMEFLANNPLRKIGNFREVEYHAPQEKIQYYTAEEYARFAACARADAEKSGFLGYYVFFSIAFFTGMRKGEINALRWSDLENDIIHVRRSVTQKVKGEAIVETSPKSKSSYRDLQAPRPLLEILSEARKLQERDPRFNDSYRVCGAIRCLSDTNIENKNKQYAKSAGLHKIRVHDFRHTHASLLANEGINIQEIARRLGHSDVETTWKTYAHLYPREEERAVKVLETLPGLADL